MPGDQEVVPYMLFPILAKFISVFRAIQKLFYRERGAFDRMTKKAGIFMSYL